MNDIARIDAWLLNLPLEQPYRLAFGPVVALDTVLVRLRLEDGAEGFGEATLLTGYTSETIEGTWARATELMASAPDAVMRSLDALDASHPFLTTAFRSAEEMARRSPLLEVGATAATPVRVPILGLLQGDDAGALVRKVDDLVEAGYTTVKLKVGFEPVGDAASVEIAQRALAGRARLRIDANQGYSAADARAFVERVDPSGIELFEQPCAADDWAAHMSVVPLASRTGLPLMLDESIYSLREIERAAELGAARFIKVKLMKFNSLARLDAALVRIGELGMTPVLGNGVATELSCWMEACIAARRIGNAGEMNGFLKPRERFFTRPLGFRRGAIELTSDQPPELDIARLARLARAALVCERGPSRSFKLPERNPA